MRFHQLTVNRFSSQSLCRLERFKYFGIVSALVFIVGAGCTNLFLQPNRVLYPYAKAEGLTHSTLSLSSTDKLALTAWYFESQENQARWASLQSEPACEKPSCLTPTWAVALQVHGNAENMTSHFLSLAWLLGSGVDLLTFDYRGYGRSEGNPDLGGSIEDIKAAIHLATQLSENRHLPLLLFGQSLGGTMLLKALETEHPRNLKAIVIEGSFADYQEIARMKIATGFIGSLLAPLSSVLVSNQYKPDLNKLPAAIPVFYLYSSKDPVVPSQQTQKLIAATRAPRFEWHHDEPYHLASFLVEDGKYRKVMLDQLRASILTK